MPIQELTYNGRKIVISTEGDKPNVTIDGESIPIFHEITLGQYSTRYLPYATFSSLIDLAKGVIDGVINQRPN